MKKQVWIGLCGWLAGTLVLFLCNHDGYHFPLLVGLLYPLIFISVVFLSIHLAPAVLAEALTANRQAMKSLHWKTVTFAFLWVTIFFGVGFAYLWGLEYLRGMELPWTGHTTGKIISLGYTSSKEGRVEWAIYEYEADGVPLKSAVRNTSRGFQTGQIVDVGYTPLWPRHSNPNYWR